MTEITDPQGLSRRDFLRTATLTAVAAAAAGGGAATLLDSRQTAPVITTLDAPASAGIVANVAPSIPSAGGAAAAAGASQEIMTLLTRSQAENLQLRAQLDQALRDLESLRAGESDARQSSDTLRMELSDANTRLGVLGGLVALYQQLDDIDPSAVVENGLSALGTKLDELLGGAPLLSSGLDTGALALAQIEAELPTLESGRQWLAEQSLRLQGFYGQLESLLREAVDRVGDFFQMLGDWFDGVRKWLPFGVGDKAARVMSGITTLIAETPNTLAGLDANLARPLDAWLTRVDGEPLLQRQVVRPLRDEVITRARQTIEQTHQTGAAYNEQLATPTRAVLDQRRLLREQIAAYRQQNQL